MKSIILRLHKFIFRHLIRKSKYLPILFIHIPKTAGTSVRKSAIYASRIKHVYCDYGKENETTSTEIKSAYRSKDSHTKIKSFLNNSEDFLLTGHFPVERYISCFYPFQIFTFVRHPVERVVSDYYHKVRVNGHSESLRTFISSNYSKNMQVKYLRGLDLQYFGFIGLSEKYRQSINLINEKYSINLGVYNVNTNPYKSSQTYDIPNEIYDEIVSANAEEFELYKKAVALFEYRLSLPKVKHPVYGTWWVEDEKLVGRAYRAYDESSVELVIHIDDEQIGTIIADKYLPIPNDVKQPRKGYIGFEFVLAKRKYENIIVYTTDTKEKLFPM